MSGHSKWSTIKRQKGINDAKKGQLFSKLARAITLAAKQGGADPTSNIRLKVEVERAKQANMPKENIERALSKASAVASLIEEVIYEGYGPQGTPIIVEAATDNKNRITQEIKNLFTRGGGNLASPGSVSFQFEKVGQIVIGKDQNPQNQMLSLIDLGAEDIEEVEDGIEIWARPENIFPLKEKIEASGNKILSTSLIFRPKTAPIALNEEKTKKVLNLLESLDNHEDVQQVYTNIKI